MTNPLDSPIFLRGFLLEFLLCLRPVADGVPRQPVGHAILGNEIGAESDFIMRKNTRSGDY